MENKVSIRYKSIPQLFRRYSFLMFGSKGDTLGLNEIMNVLSIFYLHHTQLEINTVYSNDLWEFQSFNKFSELCLDWRNVKEEICKKLLATKNVLSYCSHFVTV
jgi:hypothetical protein